MASPTEQHLHKDLTEQVIGSAMLVHRELGPGLSESCYENALCLEFAERRIGFSQQTGFPVSYRGHVVGKLIPDLIADGKVIVENKVVDSISDQHVAQILTYLSITNLQIGPILNYKHTSLKVRRVARTHPS